MTKLNSCHDKPAAFSRRHCWQCQRTCEVHVVCQLSTRMPSLDSLMKFFRTLHLLSCNHWMPSGRAGPQACPGCQGPELLIIAGCRPLSRMPAAAAFVVQQRSAGQLAAGYYSQSPAKPCSDMLWHFITSCKCSRNFPTCNQADEEGQIITCSPSLQPKPLCSVLRLCTLTAEAPCCGTAGVEPSMLLRFWSILPPRRLFAAVALSVSSKHGRWLGRARELILLRAGLWWGLRAGCWH